MRFVVLDPDVVSLAQKRRLPEEFADRLIGETICITFVTVGELHK